MNYFLQYVKRCLSGKMKNLKNIYLLIKNNRFESALNELDKFNEKNDKTFEYYYLKGFTYLSLNKLNNAIKNFSLAIKINQNYVLSYFYRGISYFKLNKLNEAKSDYAKAILLKPDLAELHNNLANVSYKNGENEEAIDSFIKSLNLNINLKSSILGLLNVLTQTENVKESSSIFVSTHKELNKVKFEYSEDKIIDDIKIKEFLKNVNDIVDKKLNNLDLNIVQTYKENKSQPNCKRHLKVFNKYKIIPEFCFGCYKIQIEPENVIDLIKLHIIFDNYNFKNNNIRKCMIELRPYISGKYKGLIYCDSIKEADEISKKLSIVLKNNLNKKIELNIKRGCSEYALEYNEYKNLNDNAMSYNKEWKKYEDLFDKEYPEYNFKRKTKETIKGISLYDVLVIRNWLAFAKLIEDQSHKIISDKFFYSKLIETKLKIKLQKN